MPETGREKGFKEMGISIVSNTRIDVLSEGGRELYTRPRVGNNLGNTGCIGESDFDPVELWVMDPPCGLKVGRVVTSCTIM